MNEKTLTSEQRATLIAYILMTTKLSDMSDNLVNSTSNIIR